ncbi:hypothetical protein [Peribacillus simplex]|nr:hypothetical protein [Peribacillus simplex]
MHSIWDSPICYQNLMNSAKVTMKVQSLPVHFERLSNLKVIASLRGACYSLGVIPAGFKPI